MSAGVARSCFWCKGVAGPALRECGKFVEAGRGTSWPILDLSCALIARFVWLPGHLVEPVGRKNVQASCCRSSYCAWLYGWVEEGASYV